MPAPSQVAAGVSGVEWPGAALERFEQTLVALCDKARILPAVTAGNGKSERDRLATTLARGGMPVPRFTVVRKPVPRATLQTLDGLRREALHLPLGALYLEKLDELELDLLLLDALGTPRLVRPLSLRRYPTGATPAPTLSGPVPLRQCARRILDLFPPTAEARVLAAYGQRESLSALIEQLAAKVGLEVSVQIEPRLSAGAATGERTVFVAQRRFGRIEARRLAVHEVLGHLVTAHNARAQPLRLLQVGTADSFIDQEGLALHMEEAFGVLDGTRLRTLAGRVLCTDLMHAGASYAEAARTLYRQEGFTAVEASGIAERAYRGGGVARDASYLLGWLRVHAALANGTLQLDELRLGRVSLSALPELRLALRQGYVRQPLLRPVLGNLARSFCSTSWGTTPLRSPPSEAASLIRLELTKK